jgi:hypothetical protein
MRPFFSGRTYRILVEALLGEFAEAPLYADLAGLGLPNKAHWLKRLVRTPELHGKLVYGSDFPLPPIPLAFAWQLGRRCREIQALPSWLDRDIALKSALGLEEDVFRRGSVLLAERIAAADAITGQGAAAPSHHGPAASGAV